MRVRGVIPGIPVDEDLERLKGSIRGGEVKWIRRLQRLVDSKRIDSSSVLLKSQGPVLPVGCWVNELSS